MTVAIHDCSYPFIELQELMVGPHLLFVFKAPNQKATASNWANFHPHQSMMPEHISVLELSCAQVGPPQVFLVYVINMAFSLDIFLAMNLIAFVVSDHVLFICA